MSLASEDPCTVLYRNIGSTIKSGFVSNNTKSEIDKNFLDENLTPAKRAKKAFNLIIEDRLKMLNPKIQIELRKLLDERITVDSNVKNLDGAFVPSSSGKLDQDKIELAIPNSLRESIIHYSVLIHEFEHAVAMQIERGGVEKTANPLMVPVEIFKALKYGAGRIYENEANAMMAEFEYLRTIPLEAKYDLSLAIIGDSTMSYSTSSFTLRSLNSLATNPEEYVEHQRDIGRYSYAKAEAINNDNKKEVIKILSRYGLTSGSASAAGYGHYYCAKIRKNILKSEKEISPITKVFCNQYP
jgi:hypothetical protein